MDPNAQSPKDKATGLTAPAPLTDAKLPQKGSVLRQHFITQIYGRVIEMIGLFNPKMISTSHRLMMRNDPDVHFASAVNRGALINNQWTVSGRDEKIKAAVRSEFKDKFRAIARSASLGLGLGYQVTEKVWKAGPSTIEIEDKVGGLKETVKVPMMWTFDRFKSIDPRFVVLHVDREKDQWDGVQQYVTLGPDGSNAMGLVGTERVALFTNQIDDNFGRLTGWAMFDASYSDWWDKSAVGMYANHYFEIKGDPNLVARAVNDQVTDTEGIPRDGFGFMANIVRLMRQGNGVVIPSDRDEKGEYLYSVEYLKDDKRGDQFESYLKYKSQMILQGQLVPARVGGAHAGSGLGTKDAGVQQDQHAEFQEKMVSDFVDYLNAQYVAPYVIYNFGLEAYEDSKTRIEVSGLSSGMKSLLKDILFKAFDEEMTLGSGKNVPLYKQLDAPAIMKELDVPMPSAEDLAQLEADQEEVNQEAQDAADLANAGGGKPPMGGDSDPSTFSRHEPEDLGEIDTRTREEREEALAAKIGSVVQDLLAKDSQSRALELARKADPAPVEHHTHVTIAEGAVKNDHKIEVAAAPAPNVEVKAGDVHHHAAPTTISTEIHAHPGKKTVTVVDAEGKSSTAIIQPEKEGSK